MLSHLHTLFSSKSFKAWTAGLSVAVSAYLIPVVSNWFEGLTPEALTNWFAGYGISIDYGLATVILGLLGVISTYLVKNKR